MLTVSLVKESDGIYFDKAKLLQEPMFFIIIFFLPEVDIHVQNDHAYVCSRLMLTVSPVKESDGIYFDNVSKEKLKSIIILLICMLYCSDARR